MGNIQKEVQTKLAKGLLYLIVLQFLNAQPMHGYQIITKIRKSFGVYFGAKHHLPAASQPRKERLRHSEWNMKTERPRKIYTLTTEGNNLLNFTEDSLSFICRKISSLPNTGVTVEPSNQASLKPMLKKIRTSHTII